MTLSWHHQAAALLTRVVDTAQRTDDPKIRELSLEVLALGSRVETRLPLISEVLSVVLDERWEAGIQREHENTRGAKNKKASTPPCTPPLWGLTEAASTVAEMHHAGPHDGTLDPSLREARQPPGPA